MGFGKEGTHPVLRIIRSSHHLKQPKGETGDARSIQPINRVRSVGCAVVVWWCMKHVKRIAMAR